MSTSISRGFRTLEETPGVTIHIDGHPTEVPAQVSVAAALLHAGLGSVRATAISGAARAPYCMMGVCFECLVEIDGRPNLQSCLVAVAPGMQVRTQRGARAFPHETGEGHDAG